jgi:hypothetical protein
MAEDVIFEHRGRNYPQDPEQSIICRPSTPKMHRESSSLAMMRDVLSGKMPSGRHSVDGIDNDKLPTLLIVDKEHPLGALVC